MNLRVTLCVLLQALIVLLCIKNSQVMVPAGGHQQAVDLPMLLGMNPHQLNCDRHCAAKYGHVFHINDYVPIANGRWRGRRCKCEMSPPFQAFMKNRGLSTSGCLFRFCPFFFKWWLRVKGVDVKSQGWMDTKCMLKPTPKLVTVHND